MAAVVEGKDLLRNSKIFEPRDDNGELSETDRIYRERLQRYCMLLAKEREVLQKLERARRASTAGLQWMDSDSSLTSRSRTGSVLDMKSLSRHEKAVPLRKCSMQVPLSRSTSQIEPKHGSRRLSQPITFTARTATPLPEKPIANSNEKRPTRPILRKTNSTQAELTTSKIRVLESQRKIAQRMQRMQSLEEDCQKAQQLMKKYKSVSLSRLDLISEQQSSTVADGERKLKSKSWLV